MGSPFTVQGMPCPAVDRYTPRASAVQRRGPCAVKPMLKSGASFRGLLPAKTRAISRIASPPLAVKERVRMCF